MALAFNKLNLIYLLINANIKKGRSRFVSDLITHCDARIDAHQKRVREARKSHTETSKHLRDKNKISRSTLYNYFGSLDALGIKFNEHESIKHAAFILHMNPGIADKFYSRFNDVLFKAFFEFMIDNRFIKQNPSIMYAEDVSNPLFFSVNKFLSLSENEMAEARRRLSGYYVVFRPSLRESEKVIISCAQISCDKLGVLQYRENMHYKSGGFGWTKQIFTGYIFRSADRYTIITTDTNTAFVQMSYLKARHVNHLGEIIGLSGSYNGVSPYVSNDFFSTGIVLYRNDKIKAFSRYDIEKWRQGLIPGFGLVSKDSIDAQIRRYLFSFNPVYE